MAASIEPRFSSITAFALAASRRTSPSDSRAATRASRASPSISERVLSAAASSLATSASVPARVSLSRALASERSARAWLISSLRPAIEPEMRSMWSIVSEIRPTLSSSSRRASRVATVLTLATTSSPEASSFCSAESSAMIRGRTSSPRATSLGEPGLPPASWMMATPVRPWKVRRAVVSVVTGVPPTTRMRAITWRASSGARISRRTSPTWMPLNCTAPPTDRPVTASWNTTSYSSHSRSSCHLPIHSTNSIARISTANVKAPIRT